MSAAMLYSSSGQVTNKLHREAIMAYMADIFVSYASEDRDRILPLVKRLEAAGWSVWWDRELVTGPSFDTKIEEALDAAKCVVVAWSKYAVDSRWVRSEANEGLERDILVPVVIDDVRPPLAFRMSHTADLKGWPALDGEVSALIEGVANLLGVDPTRNSKEERREAIAVLPFANMSADPEQEFFGDGIAEEVINGLVNWGRLKVIARTSSFKFKGQNEDIRKIGEVLGVTHILEGSVRKAGDRLRVTAQLIDTSDGAHLWSERFDRQQSDVFEMQDDITAAIVSALQGELSPALSSAIKRTKGTHNVVAYQAYVNGRFHLAQGSTLPNYLAAVRELKRAIELDPDFADAYGVLSNAYFGLAFWNPPARMDRIEEAVSKARALDPGQPDAELTEASLYLYRDHDIHKAINAWNDILERRPTDVLALYRRYIGLMSVGVSHTETLDRLLELDPLYQTHYRHRAAIYLRNGLLEDALRDAERAIELDANDPFGWMMLYRIAEQHGDEDAMQANLKRLQSLVGDRHAMYAQVTENKELAREILDDPSSVKTNPPLNLASIAFWIGDEELAMTWFLRAMERGDFMAIQQCRAWMGQLFGSSPEERKAKYERIVSRDDYRAIMQRFNLDDGSIADLQDLKGEWMNRFHD
jgi:TolB-like protein